MNKGWALEYDLLDDSKEYTFEDKVRLVEQLLDSDSNLFSTKVRDWLMKKDMCTILIRFITRTAENDNVDPVDKNISSDNFVLSSNQRRDALLAEIPENSESEDEELQFSVEAKRADKAAEVFVYQASALPSEFFEKNFENMVCEIFKIFSLESKGDFDNFDKIFQSVLAPHSSQLVQILSRHTKMGLHPLNYLHDPAVSETLMAILRMPLAEQHLIAFYNSLNADGFFSYLGNKIYGENSASSFNDATAFFIRLVELCSTFSNADILFMELTRDASFIDGLLSVISNQSGNSSIEQQVCCIYALKTLLVKSGEQLFDASLESYQPTAVPNMLAGIHDDLHEYLKTRAGPLCQKLLDDAKNSHSDGQPETLFSAFRVKKKFTLHRLALLEILVELTDQNPHSVLDCFVNEVWRVLSDWLFDHKFNNLYHATFFKLFKALVRSNHVASIKALFSRYKFVTKIIQHYKSFTVANSGLRGFILLIANTIRLMADILPPTEYLCSFLQSHQLWKEFLPILKEETIRQHVTQYSAPSTGSQFSAFSLHEAFGMYSGGTKCKPVLAEDVDIDLGSEYANSLGFEGCTAYSTNLTKNKRKRRRKKKQGSLSPAVTANANGKDKGKEKEGVVVVGKGQSDREEKDKDKEKEGGSAPSSKKGVATENGGDDSPASKPLSAADIFASAVSRQAKGNASPAVNAATNHT